MQSNIGEIICQYTDVCDKNYAVILNKNIVKLMIDNLSELYPGILEEMEMNI